MIQRPAAPVTLTQPALDWALSHLTRFGDTVFLPEAFEFTAVRHDWVNISRWLGGQDLRDWAPRPHRRFLAAKTQGSFRYVTQLDPLEHLAFTGLMHDLGQELEAMRSSPSNNRVFSWRFMPRPDGTMYDPNYRWSEFNDRCLQLASAPATRFVVVADIADFFHHLYLHPLERTLDRCTASAAQAYCVLRLIKSWNARVSYGIPVGPPAARILAEAALADLDTALEGDGAIYCRYADDFRIFCRTRAEARKRLEFLAEHLFEIYGLTLQASKSLILEANEYLGRFSLSPTRAEAESLEENFRDLLLRAGLDVEYDEDIDYDDLPEDVQAQIAGMNLAELFETEIAKERFDPIVVSFILHRLGQLDDDGAVDAILTNLAKLEPVINAAVRYLAALRDLSTARRREIGDRVITAATGEGASKYQIACLLSIFTSHREFDNENRFERMYEAASPEGKRKLVLAMGRAAKRHWFMARRRDSQAWDPWLRRAFLAGGSCMDRDVKRAFYEPFDRFNDVLDRAIVAWVTAHPFA